MLKATGVKHTYIFRRMYNTIKNNLLTKGYFKYSDLKLLY